MDSQNAQQGNSENPAPEKMVVVVDEPLVPPFWGAQVWEPTIEEVYPHIERLSLLVGRWGFKKGNLPEAEYRQILEGEAQSHFERLKRENLERRLLVPRAAVAWHTCRPEGDSLIMTAHGTGKTYVQNPAHPQVYKRFVDYLDALLAEYGDEIDALYFDETYYVRTGTVSGGERPAYACVAMMRLVRDLTQRVSRKYPNVAFLASDVIGLTQDGTNLWLDIPPYGIMSHGCYQDSHCQPETWPYGIFPNYRNVMWSCNWSPIRRLDYTRFGARHYRAPVALSNGWQDAKGTWQDGRGVAALNAQQRDAVMALFNERKQHRQQLKWLTGPAPVFEEE